MMLPFVVPPADSFVRYFNWDTRQWMYLWLVEKEEGLKYPFRFPALAPGAEQASPTIIDEPKPMAESPHIYLAMLGLWPGFRYTVYYPYNRKTLMFEEEPQDISRDVTAYLDYDDSPHDAPKYPLWLTNKTYPGFQPRNITYTTMRPQIQLDITRYRIMRHERIPADVMARLVSGELPSMPISFGGAF